jgi:hypothetical protein
VTSLPEPPLGDATDYSYHATTRQLTLHLICYNSTDNQLMVCGKIQIHVQCMKMQVDNPGSPGRVAPEYRCWQEPSMLLSSSDDPSFWTFHIDSTNSTSIRMQRRVGIHLSCLQEEWCCCPDMQKLDVGKAFPLATTGTREHLSWVTIYLDFVNLGKAGNWSKCIL